MPDKCMKSHNLQQYRNLGRFIYNNPSKTLKTSKENMIGMHKLILCAITSISYVSCSAVAKPSSITLEDAMASVGRGLVLMKQEQIKQNKGKTFRSGLVASKAIVTFNIAASSSRAGKLYVDLSPGSISPLPIAGKAGAEASGSLMASRGNQITMEFASILFNTTTKKNADGSSVTVVGAVDAETLAKTVQGLDKEDFTSYAIPSLPEQ